MTSRALIDPNLCPVWVDRVEHIYLLAAPFTRHGGAGGISHRSAMGVFFLNFLRALKGPTRNLLLRTTLFFVYLLFGAAVFQTLESGAERKEKDRFDVVQRSMKDKYNISDLDMQNFYVEISKAIDEGYFDVNFDRWSFTGSLFFTGTVVTTIGKAFTALSCVLLSLTSLSSTSLFLFPPEKRRNCLRKFLPASNERNLINPHLAIQQKHRDSMFGYQYSISIEFESFSRTAASEQIFYFNCV